jgi:trimeric autotransporter adhesin
MTRTRIVFISLFALTIGACGGRSGLHLETADGGGAGDAKLDAKRDGNLDTTILPDTPPDIAVTPDIAVQPDVAAPDLPAPEVGRLDARPIDVAPIDVARPDASDARTDLVRLDGSLPEVPRLDTNVPDRRDGGQPDSGDVAPTISSIEIAPPSTTVGVGTQYSSFIVTAVRSDGTTSDVTTTATLSSADTSIAQVSGHTVTGVKAGSTTITATYQGKTATAKVTVTAAALQSISIDGVAPVSVGQYILVTATGIFADGTKQDVTAQATWASADTTLATLALDTASSKEKITGVKAGLVSVSATLQGITGKVSVTVTAATITSIAVTPAQPILQRGVSQPFQATATYSDGTTGDVTLQATWSSSDTVVATVTTNTTGVVVRAIAPVNATISATVGSITGSTTVTVTSPTLASIAVTPATWSPNVGGVQAFTATGTYSDKSTADLTISVSWSSANTNVVSISNAAGQKGQATALATGTTQVQATLSGLVGSADITVSASPLVSIAVTPNPFNMILGITGTLTATGTYQNGTTQDLTKQVTWSVGDSSVIGISNLATTAGQVTPLAVGNTSAVATLGTIAGKAAVSVAQAKLTAIAVTPASATVTAGAKQQFKATGTYDNNTTTDLTTQVTWSSDDISVTQISNAAGSNGLATSLVAGKATITAALAGVSATATLTVGAPSLSSIMISPTTASIEVKVTQSFSVTAVYQNGTTAAVAATWSSSNEGVATVAATAGGRRGTATGVAAGTTTITATFNGLTDTASLSVTEVPTLVGLTITPSTLSELLVGATQQLQANAVFSNGNTQVVTTQTTWTSTDPTVASVSSAGGGGFGRGAGLVTAIGAGKTTINAVYNNLNATISLSVRAPQPTGLLITPTSATIRVGATQQFVALVTMEDGTTQTVTNQAAWTTSSGTIVSITTGGGGGLGGGGNRGLATGVSAGTATVTATYNNYTAKASLTVTSAKATSLVVTPASPSIQVGQTQAFVATVVFDDNTTAVVTAQTTWTSSDASVAVVSNATGGGPGGGTGGVATAIATGKTTITGSYDGLTGTADLAIADPPVASIQVTPTNAAIAVNGTRQYTATAVFSDNTTRDVTSLATWSSSDSSVALVASTGNPIGRLSGVGAGSATITATYKGISGTTTVYVGTVQSISLTPTNATTVIGLPVTFTATALLSNGKTVVVTAESSWVSSDPTAVTVTANGVATPVTSGSVTVAAGYQGKSGTTTLTVSKATLSSIDVSPAKVALSLAATASVQLTATGVYSDSTTYDLTNVVTWLSSAASVASVSNASGSRGLVTGLVAGTSNVTAAFQTVTSTAAAITVAQ